MDVMKPLTVYGEKTFFLAFLGLSVLSLTAGVTFALLGLFLKIDWLYYPAFFFAAGFLYVLYLAFYEGLFRYEKLRKTQGKIVRVLLSHTNPATGIVSTGFIGVLNFESPHPVTGTLVGTFGPFFYKHYVEGSVVFCYRLKTGELLFLADQKHPERSLADL